MKAPKTEYSRHLLLSSSYGSVRKEIGYDEEQINNVVKFLYGSELRSKHPFEEIDRSVAELFKDFRGYVCRSCGVDQEALEKKFEAEFGTVAVGENGPIMYGETDRLKGELIDKMMRRSGGADSYVVCYAVRGLFQYLQEKAKLGDKECSTMAEEMLSIFPSNTIMGRFVTSRDDCGIKAPPKFLPTLDVPSDVKEFMEGYELDLRTRLVRQEAAKPKGNDAPSGKAFSAQAAAATAISRGWETSFFIK